MGELGKFSKGDVGLPTGGTALHKDHVHCCLLCVSITLSALVWCDLRRQMPRSAVDRNPLPTLFVEVSALQACQGLQGALRLLDYFLCPVRGYVLVTELCECTVQEWRAQVPGLL